jgi:hypothetical protein
VLDVMYCSYYQANIVKSECWFFVAILRSFENVAFDRTLDKDTCLFEFFVTPGREHIFVALMNDMISREIVSNFVKMDNRMELEE